MIKNERTNDFLRYNSNDQLLFFILTNIVQKIGKKENMTAQNRTSHTCDNTTYNLLQQRNIVASRKRYWLEKYGICGEIWERKVQTLAEEKKYQTIYLPSNWR